MAIHTKPDEAVIETDQLHTVHQEVAALWWDINI